MPLRSRSRCSVPVDRAQLVESAVEAVADHAAVAHQGGGLVDERLEQHRGERRIDVGGLRQLRDGRPWAAAHRVARLAQQLQALRQDRQGVFQCNQFARPHAGERNAGRDPLDVGAA